MEKNTSWDNEYEYTKERKGDYAKECIIAHGDYNSHIKALIQLASDELSIDVAAASRVVVEAGVIRHGLTPQETYDQAIVAPIVMLSPYVEMLKTGESLEDWYAAIAANTFALVDATTPHSLNCIDRTVVISKNLKCSMSERVDCPVASLRSQLILPIDKRNFDADDGYRVDPEKMMAIATSKLSYAYELGLIEKSQHDILNGQYQRRFQSRTS